MVVSVSDKKKEKRKFDLFSGYFLTVFIFLKSFKIHSKKENYKSLVNLFTLYLVEINGYSLKCACHIFIAQFYYIFADIYIHITPVA